MKSFKFVAFCRHIYSHACLFTSLRSHREGVVTHLPLIVHILKVKVAKAKVEAVNQRTGVMLRAPSGWLHFTTMGSKSKCASGGIFALAVNSMIVLSFMAAQLMLVAVHVVRITRPTCIRPESARRFLRAKRLGSPCPLQVRYLRLGIRLPPQRIFCPFLSKPSLKV